MVSPKKILPEINNLLNILYDPEKASTAFTRIQELIANFPKKEEQIKEYFSQEDIVLITYADSLVKKDEKPLQTLKFFSETYLKDIFSTIHLLPFFPYSSDDGFSVIDYLSVSPSLGSWEDINQLHKNFKLMFDLVLNHISAQSPWFKAYLQGQKEFKELAIEIDPQTDLSQVTRPRSLPLLTTFTKTSGEKIHLWTTFSADQIDLNFSSINVLIKMIEVLLFYLLKGATIIRLDAIAYLWKKLGTNCIHLKQTHAVVKLFKNILTLVAPKSIIITETNVPHQENISYFGNGYDEAQMVYNFTLPPLLFHTFCSENSEILSDWAKTLILPSAENTFFNFTASHDGIGVRPLEGIITPEALEKLIKIVKENKGQVSYKKNPDGTESPYELNITYVDAFLNKNFLKEQPKRFLASQAIQLAIPGVPAVYIHSLLGSHNWTKGVKLTGRARTINREKLKLDKITTEIENPKTFRGKIFPHYIHLLKTRRKQPAFHPKAPLNVLNIDPKIFAIIRKSTTQTIYALTNISSESFSLVLQKHNIPEYLTDLLSEKTIARKLKLNPYQTVWLTNNNQP